MRLSTHRARQRAATLPIGPFFLLWVLKNKLTTDLWIIWCHPGLGVGQEGLELYLFTGCLHMDGLVSSNHVHQPFVLLSELLWIKCLIARFDWMWPEWETKRAWDLECILRVGMVTSAEIATEEAAGWIQMQARRRQQKLWRNLQKSMNWIWMITAPAISLCEDVTGSWDGTPCEWGQWALWLRSVKHHHEAAWDNSHLVSQVNNLKFMWRAILNSLINKKPRVRCQDKC